MSAQRRTLALGVGSLSCSEHAACQAVIPRRDYLNRNAQIPFGVTPDHIYAAMSEWIEFLSFVNDALHGRRLARLETMLMPANFSSMVGEFMGTSIPKHCASIVRNQYHNGHPDLIPFGAHPRNALQHHDQGIEIKASRHRSGWQGHNAEDTWLMVFVFISNSDKDAAKSIAPRPFEFLAVLGAELQKTDWKFSGRSETSRRTITASVTPSGYQKMSANWIYRAPEFTVRRSE